jgi:hypothetical protein
MAINPSDPNGGTANQPNSGNGSGAPNNQSGPRPRATIMLKKNQGSSDKIPAIKPTVPPATGTPGMSGRLPVAPASVSGRSGVMRAPGQSQRRAPAQIATDREALGLSAARPSEMVKGLDEAAKRAQAAAERDENKRRSGGKMSQVEALQVDDTGRRWSNRVIMGMAAVFLTICGVGGYLIYKTANPGIDYRVAFEETHRRMHDLARDAELMPPFAEGEKLTPATVKERIEKNVREQLEVILKQAAIDRDAKRNPDLRITDRRNFLQDMLKFTDGWGRPLRFAVEDDAYVVISADPLPGKEIPVAERAKIRAGATVKTADGAK